MWKGGNVKEGKSYILEENRYEYGRYRGAEIRGRNQQAHYRAQAQPRSDPGPVQAQVRAQAQYRARAQIRTHQIHARRGVSNHRRFMIEEEGRDTPPTLGLEWKRFDKGKEPQSNK